MSIGFFMTVRASYATGCEREAGEILDALTGLLRKRGLPEYTDPSTPPDVYNGTHFGRSALDHHGARVLCRLDELAKARGVGTHFSLRGDRAIYLPLDFAERITIRYGKGLWFLRKIQDFGSLPHLTSALQQLAPDLGIPLNEGHLSDETARKINDLAPLYESDTCELAEDERTAWLLMYEGARLAQEQGVALVSA